MLFFIIIVYIYFWIKKDEKNLLFIGLKCTSLIEWWIKVEFTDKLGLTITKNNWEFSVRIIIIIIVVDGWLILIAVAKMLNVFENIDRTIID